MAELDKWEYMSTVIEASMTTKKVLDYLKKHPPDDINAIKPYSPSFLVIELNELGDDGWELIHIEPLMFGNNMDVAFGVNTDGYTRKYLCVFKRKKS